MGSSVATAPQLHPETIRVGEACERLGWDLWTSSGSGGDFLWASRASRAIRVGRQNPRLIVPHRWGFGALRGTAPDWRWLPDSTTIHLTDVPTPEALFLALLNIGGTAEEFPIPTLYPVESHQIGGITVNFHPWRGVWISGNTYPIRKAIKSLGLDWTGGQWISPLWPDKKSRVAILEAIRKAI